MDPTGDDPNQPWRGGFRKNDSNYHNVDEDLPEEKVHFELQDSNPVVDVNTLTAQSALQQRLIERMQAEERLYSCQENQQQMFQLAQNQARRAQLLQQQLHSELQSVVAASAVPDSINMLQQRSAVESVPLIQSQMQLEQRRYLQLDHLRVRRQYLLQLQLLRDQRMRQEEELLQEVLIEQRRQAAPFGTEGGMNNIANASMGAQYRDTNFVQPAFDVAAAILPGLRSNPNINLVQRHRNDGEALLGQIIQNQRNQASLLNVSSSSANTNLWVGRNQDNDPNIRNPTINTAPASLSGIDPSRVESAVQLSRKNHQSGNIPGKSDYASIVQGGTVPQWMHPSAVASRFHASTEAKKPFEKKKSVSRKKVAGMPKRPLHAYNIYFQEERQKILQEIPSPPDDKAEEGLTPGARRKRRRRGTHGKITFASLAKEIGYKWQNLSKEEKEHYQQQAEIELQRYDDEMDVYNLKKKEDKTETEQQLDEPSDKKPKAKDGVELEGEKTRVNNEDDDDDSDNEEGSGGADTDNEDTSSIIAVSAKKSRK